MKKVFIVLLFSLLTSNLFAQAGIKIYTLSDEAKFKVMIDGVLENTIPIKEIVFDTLNYKQPHKIVLSFTADSVADILKKQEIRKKNAKFGRKIGKLLKIGKHDKDEVLWDIFYLEERTKSEYLND
jgi:hypothetical protein